MQKFMVLFGLIGIIIFTTNYAYSQEPSLATFQETAQVIIDKNISQNVTASITLQSTNIQEIKTARDHHPPLPRPPRTEVGTRRHRPRRRARRGRVDPGERQDGGALPR